MHARKSITVILILIAGYCLSDLYWSSRGVSPITLRSAESRVGLSQNIIPQEGLSAKDEAYDRTVPDKGAEPAPARAEAPAAEPRPVKDEAAAVPAPKPAPGPHRAKAAGPFRTEDPAFLEGSKLNGFTASTAPVENANLCRTRIGAEPLCYRVVFQGEPIRTGDFKWVRAGDGDRLKAWRRAAAVIRLRTNVYGYAVKQAQQEAAQELFRLTDEQAQAFPLLRLEKLSDESRAALREYWGITELSGWLHLKNRFPGGPEQEQRCAEALRRLEDAKLGPIRKALPESVAEFDRLNTIAYSRD